MLQLTCLVMAVGLFLGGAIMIRDGGKRSRALLTVMGWCLIGAGAFFAYRGITD